MGKEYSYRTFFYSLIGIIMILFILSIKNCSAQIPKDKQLHFGAGVVISGWSYTIPIDQTGWKPVIYGLSGSVIAGGAKELYDLTTKTGHAEWKDLGATILGSIVSVGIITGIKRLVKHHKRNYKIRNEILSNISYLQDH